MVERNLPRILVLEDERNLALTLVERLKRENYEVSWAASAMEARLEITQRRFDLALLDVGLPDGSGFDIAGELRKLQPGTAIIFLTAFGAAEDRIRGLEIGAEDYVVKPYHFKELLLRIQNGLRRVRYVTSVFDEGRDFAQIGKAKINFAKFEAETDGVITALTHKECALLRLLAERRGKVVSRDEILNHVWSEDEFPTARTIDNFIMRLRRLVEFDNENPQVIKSVRGVGYLLTAETEGK